MSIAMLLCIRRINIIPIKYNKKKEVMAFREVMFYEQETNS